MANTYGDNYGDHGFLIYGVRAKTIVGITKTEQNVDKFQNDVDQLLKTYISPMPQVHVVGFEADGGKKWGTIIIPPRNDKPYAFFKEFPCQNPAKTRKRGEWFVRRGSTTDPGLPEDLNRINQKQINLIVEPLRESIHSLQTRIGKLEEQNNIPIARLVEWAVSIVSSSSPSTPPLTQAPPPTLPPPSAPPLAKAPTPTSTETQEEKGSADIGLAFGVDLPTRLKQKLRTPKDTIAESLVSEARTLQEFLTGASTGLSWAPHPRDESNKSILETLEVKTRTLQKSIATILLNDSKGEYTDSLLQSIRVLARAPEAPPGVGFNHIGEALRYYPLGMILYTAFSCGVAANRSDVLKQVLQIPLKYSRGRERIKITHSFFIWHGADDLFNNALGQKWCEPIPQRIRQVMSDHVSELITNFSEPEGFFRGEFVLALSHIDDCIERREEEKDSVPIPGLYLYIHEAHEVIEDFVLEHPSWFEKFYLNQTETILKLFDQNAHRVVNPKCIFTDFRGVKTAEWYQESIKKKTKK